MTGPATLKPGALARGSSFDFYVYPVPVVGRGYDYMEVGADHLGLHVFSKPVVPLIA